MKLSTHILMDIGSSTVKAYKLENKNLKLILSQSFHFKDGFTTAKGLTQENKTELFKIIKKIKKENPNAKINIYATAIFRKLTKSAKVKFQKEFLKNTKVKFTIISQNLENKY